MHRICLFRAGCIIFVKQIKNPALKKTLILVFLTLLAVTATLSVAFVPQTVGSARDDAVSPRGAEHFADRAVIPAALGVGDIVPIAEPSGNSFDGANIPVRDAAIPAWMTPAPDGHRLHFFTPSIHISHTFCKSLQQVCRLLDLPPPPSPPSPRKPASARTSVSSILQNVLPSATSWFLWKQDKNGPEWEHELSERR